MTAFEPFTLTPLEERDLDCPHGDGTIRFTRLRLVGWRLLHEGACDGCGHTFVRDLPTGHGLVYPSLIDVTEGRGWGQWFENDTLHALSEPDPGPVAVTIERRAEAREAVFLNCLDFVYGHSVHKLLNAQWHLDEPDGQPLVALVPSSLAALVPDGTAEVWVVDEPFRRLRGGLPALEERVLRELERFDRCVLSPCYPHPHPSTWSIERFTGPLAGERVGRPSIVLSVREDRLWGGSERRHRRNLARLWERIRAELPDAGAAVIGVSRLDLVPDGVLDLRSTAPDAAVERRWLELMRGADLALGVHGSNMLLPSALAAATVELVPENRFGNVIHASLIAEPDPLLAVFRYRYLYGDDELRDLAPERVADVAVTVLREQPNFTERLAGLYAGRTS
jgi:hypothetical protein